MIRRYRYNKNSFNKVRVILIITMTFLLIGCTSTAESDLFSMENRRTGMEDNPRFDDDGPIPRFLFGSRASYEIVLPHVIFFEMKEDVIAAIRSGDVREMDEIASIIWLLISTDEAIFYLNLDEPAIMDEFTMDREELNVVAAQLQSKFNEYRYDLGLGNGHVAGVTYVEIDSSTGAFIIQLYDIRTPRISSFVGVAYNESVGLRYFSLHKVNSEDNMFMSLIGDGHFDMEASKLIENSKEAFVTEIEVVMRGN